MLIRPSHVAMTLLLLVAPALFGQTEPEGDDLGAAPEEAATDEIVVWGDRLEESLPLELAELGSRVEVITAEEIEDGGYGDVSQILASEVPGLFVSQKNGPFDYVNASLQGSRTQEILWLVDGVRISNRLYNTTTPLDTLPASMVERIEVLKGGQSLFYGTQSVGGVINVVTRTYSAETEGEVSAGLDTNEGTHVDGFVRGGGGTQRFCGLRVQRRGRRLPALSRRGLPTELHRSRAELRCHDARSPLSSCPERRAPVLESGPAHRRQARFRHA